jgi:hypothetical protein
MDFLRPVLISFLLILLPSLLTGEECVKCSQSVLVKGSCFEVQGTLKLYNGWPPNLRIETENQEIVYGVGPVENEYMPASIFAVLPTSIEGKFKLCSFDNTTSIPSDDRKILMVCIKSVSDAWYWDIDTREKKKLKESVTN